MLEGAVWRSAFFGSSDKIEVVSLAISVSEQAKNFNYLETVEISVEVLP